MTIVKNIKNNFSNGLSILIVVVVIIVVYRVYKSVNEGSKALGNVAGDALLSKRTGIPVNRIVFLRSIANTMYTDGITNWYVAQFYDGDVFVPNLNRCVNATEAALLNELFNSISKYKLSTAVAALYATDKGKIKPYVLSQII